LVTLIEKFGHRDVAYVPDFAAAGEMLAARLEPGDLLITLGAGDVWKVGERILAAGSEKASGSGTRATDA